MFQLRGERLNLVRNFFVGLILGVFFQVICSCVVEHVKHDEVIIRGSDSPGDIKKVQRWRILAPYNPDSSSNSDWQPLLWKDSLRWDQNRTYYITDKTTFRRFVTELIEALRIDYGIDILESRSKLARDQESRIGGIIRLSIPESYVIEDHLYDEFGGVLVEHTKQYANLNVRISYRSRYGGRAKTANIPFREIQYGNNVVELVNYVASEIASTINHLSEE